MKTPDEIREAILEDYRNEYMGQRITDWINALPDEIFYEKAGPLHALPVIQIVDGQVVRSFLEPGYTGGLYKKPPTVALNEQLLKVARDFDEALGELGLHCNCGQPDCRTTRLRAAIQDAENSKVGLSAVQKVGLLAHNGGLLNLSESETLILIRRITMGSFTKENFPKNIIIALREIVAEAKKKGTGHESA